MKSLSAILAGSVALVLAGTASADVVVHITGSTAYRQPTHLAIAKLLGGTPLAAYTGSSLNGAGKAWFKGTIASAPSLGNVTIKTSWSGAVGGLQTVANQINVSFLPDTVSASVAANSSGASVTGGSSITDGTVSEIPEVAMTDNYQNSTPFTTNTLLDTVVGVVPFKWVVSNPGTGNAAPFTNMTPQLAQALWANGVISKALFTGVAADNTQLVYAVGRDPDSGTRLTAFAESGIGVNATVTQYKASIASGAVTGYTAVAQQTVNGITYPIGQGGESSGGTLAGFMGATTNGVTGYSVTYLSTGDAATAITAGAKELSYNGIPYSLTAVQEGLYTFWGYEHLMYRSDLGADPKAVADALATQIITTDATIKLNTMHVQRSADGGLVTQNY